MTRNYDADADGTAIPVGATPDHRRRDRHGRQLLIRLGIAAVGVALLATVAAGLLARQVSTVRNDLEQALSLASVMQTQLRDDEAAQAQGTFNEIDRLISSARSTTTGPLWTAATVIPLVGPNFRAVSEVSMSADDIATRAIEPLMSKFGSFDWGTLSPTDGKIDTAFLGEASPTISAAAATLRLSSERMASIDTTRLLPQVAEPVRATTEKLQEVSRALDTAASAATLLPGMLGSEEPRSYLILVQNTAEARATGGIPGALAVVGADNGQITLGEQSSAGAMGTFAPALDVDSQQEALYTARLGRQMQNVNLTPDFPTAANTAKQMWETRHPGERLDGVIALDPVVLSHLLGATGPVELTDTGVLDLVEGTALPTSLTKENVVATLLSDVYREIEDTKAQDAYFAAVASEVFSAFAAGQGASTDIIAALTKAAQDQRLYLWSARLDEQTTIATTALAGSIKGSDSGGAAFGVFFNDGTGAKMDYYARRSLELRQVCQDNGYSRYTARLVLTNVAPIDAAESLPAYVTGNGEFGIEPGSIRTNYVFYGPTQSIVETAKLNGQTISFGSGLHGQRPVGTVTVELAPNETAELELTFSRVVQETEPRIRITPSLLPYDDVLLPVSKDSSCE